MSLRLRVVLAIAVLILTGSVIGVVVAGWQAEKVLREELAAALDGGRLTVGGAFQSLARSDDPRRDLARLVASFDGARHVRASLVDDHGSIVAISHPLPVRPAPAWFAGLFHPGVAAVRLAAPAPALGTLILAPVAANDVAAVWAEFLGLVAVLAASLAVGSALVWLIVGRTLRPLADFSAAFARIGAGDYAAKVRQAGPPELARVGAAVNEMASRLAAMQARTHRLEEQITTLQDEERADLARDLHDEIGPHLFAVNVDAAMARRLIGEGRSGEAGAQVEAIQQAVGHMQRLVREILARLRPSEIIDLGLAAAVGELVAFWSARQPAIAFTVKVPDDEALGLGVAARETLYRVVQEGLNNAVRHGRPGRVEVEIARNGGEVVARIGDDGAGGGKPEGSGFGLIGMRERVAAAGGTLAIERGAGWTITARLPARAEEFEETAPA
ncbi:MAG TPA: sensor histidine kinase [Caulobacteraceae bacterium]|jgi:two-component system sensor histidine kinase UhpB